MGSIIREIYILSSRRVAPIDIVYGSAVPILFKMMDVTVPVGAQIVFYSQQADGPVYRAEGWEAENIAGFTPPEGFFALGGNLLQVEINGKLIPIAVEVRCHQRLSGVGSTETPEQVRPLVQQALDAAREARDRAAAALESQNAAAGSASAAAGSAGAAAGSANAAAGSAQEAGNSADAADQSANAAAGSAQAALESQNAAAGSASAAAGSAGAAAGSANAAAGSAQEAGNAANAAAQAANSAAGSAQAALESQNAAAGSASAAAGSAGAAAGSANAAAGSAQEAGEAANAAGQSANAAAGSAQAAEEARKKAEEEAAKCSVKTICGVLPDESGNVPLTAANVGALPTSGGDVTGEINMNGQPVSGLNPPTEDSQAANKGYVDQTVKSIFPVGYIYLSADSTSPAALFGGTWEQLKDRFLLGAGDSYDAGTTGGEAKHTLTGDEMPSHNHFSGHGWSSVSPGSGLQVLSNTLITGDSWSENITSYGGASQPHNNMPPYLAVYMWKRVA